MVRKRDANGPASFEIEIPLPEEPYYRNYARAQLEIWADDVETVSGRRHIGEEGFREIARILRHVAVSKKLRRQLYPAEGAKARGRPERYAWRDFLVALDYWLLRELHERKKGWEFSDLKDTAGRYKRFGITEHIVGHARETWRDECRTFIKSQLDSKNLELVRLGKPEKIECLRRRVRSEFIVKESHWTSND